MWRQKRSWTGRKRRDSDDHAPPIPRADWKFRAGLCVIAICIVGWMSSRTKRPVDQTVLVGVHTNVKFSHPELETNFRAVALENQQRRDDVEEREMYREDEPSQEDEDDSDEEIVLPNSRRVSVLLKKELVGTEEGSTTSKAFERDQEKYSKISDTSKRLSAAAGHPKKKGEEETGQAERPVKNIEIERHFTRGYWFVPSQKYFVYQPSGGMSNQRMILEHALIVAKALGRTLVVPPIAPHTSMFWNYNKVDWERTVEAFQIFQKERMEAAVPVLGLSNCILRRFVEFNEGKRGVKWHRVERNKKDTVVRKKTNPRGRVRWTTSDLKDMFGGIDADVLFFAQTTMWRSFDFTNEELEWAHRHVQLDSEFRRMARVAVEHLYPIGAPFLAMHTRFEDTYTQVLTDMLSPAPVFISRFERHNASQISTRLYVATQPSRITSSYFEAFRKAGFDLTFSDALMNNTEILQFLNRFPKNDIQSSVLGLLEQLICARADKFLGTGFSTFSQFIRIKRDNMVLAYDETLLPKSYRYDEVFLSQCSLRQVQQAFSSSAMPNPESKSSLREKRARNEERVLKRPRACDISAVSTKVC